MDFRIEKDSLGELKVPAAAYYGVQTQRAVENYPISGLRPLPAFVKATIQIKKAAAKVHKGLKLLAKEKADAIVKAADEVLSGLHADQFVVDIFQAGAGTSHNMNCNEVLANRACEILGGKRGDVKLCSPNDHVNMGQSTNDVIPTAIRLAALDVLPGLVKAAERLSKSFEAKAKEFDGIVKTGRTHLQDAVPVRLGQEFGAYAFNAGRHAKSIEASADGLRELGLGGSAAGTGLNVHPEYRSRVAKALSEQTGEKLRMAGDYFEAMQSMRPIQDVALAIQSFVLDLTRICNDMRMLCSGPLTGLAEIKVPAVQPGSSIMPGKINPSILEMVNQLGFAILGRCQTVSYCAQAGQLELNVMMPIIGYELISSIQWLANGVNVLCERCVDGTVADAERCKHYADINATIGTALNPHLGYLKVAECIKEAIAKKKTIVDVVVEKGLMPKEKVLEILDPRKLTEPGIHE
ncbi:MAG: aspartate ammonia-lyase [Planctomycetia bacterium]|nr:aspartate ammonia-lyase [Planctomycetia bacterium]